MISRGIAAIVFSSAAALGHAQSLVGASDRLAFDVDIDPRPDATGEYFVTISVLDLERGKSLGEPLKLPLKTKGSYTFAEFPTRPTAGADCTGPDAPLEGRCVNIFFAADKQLGRAAVEIIVTQHRQIISRHRYGVRLGG